MIGRRRARQLAKEPPELNITTFLNLMVVLVPFLLITAVFSRITILELNLPTAAGAAQSAQNKLQVEVIVRAQRLEVGDGRKVIANIPKLADGGYDLERLEKILLMIKENFPNKTDALVLMEPDIEYDYLVKVMDAVRGADNNPDAPQGTETVILFPDISIGDAP